jgi:hypothetical protein
MAVASLEAFLDEGQQFLGLDWSITTLAICGNWVVMHRTLYNHRTLMPPTVVSRQLAPAVFPSEDQNIVFWWA